MWSHPKIASKYVGNYELKREDKKWSRVLRLERRTASGTVVGKVYTFSSHHAAKKAGWKYVAQN